jgi:hypothetical protein
MACRYDAAGRRVSQTYPAGHVSAHPLHVHLVRAVALGAWAVGTARRSGLCTLLPSVRVVTCGAAARVHKHVTETGEKLRFSSG